MLNSWKESIYFEPAQYKVSSMSLISSVAVTLAAKQGSKTPLLFSNNNPYIFPPPLPDASALRCLTDILDSQLDNWCYISPFTRFFVEGKGGPLRDLKLIKQK